MGKRIRSQERSQLRRPRVEDFQVPDRTFSDYFCKICKSHMNSSDVWASHIQGKRHHKKVKEYIITLPDKQYHHNDERTPPATPVIEKRLRDISDPIVGLKYVSEINKSDLLLGPIYKCFLCHACLPNGDFLIDHLCSSKHILTYGKLIEPNEYKYMVGFGKNTLESLVAEWACSLERKYGRGRMNVEFEKQSEASDSFVAEPKTDSYVSSDNLPQKLETEHSDRDYIPSKNRRLLDVHSSDDSSPRNSRTYQERDPSYEASNSRNRYHDRTKSREMDRMRCVHEIEKLQRKLLAKEARKENSDKKRNSCVSRRKCLPERKMPCLKKNAPSDKVYAAASDSTNDVISPTKIYLNMEFLEALQNSPSSMIIKLLEKMGPYVITTDEECDRLNKIAISIERSCMDYKYSSLDSLQKKKMLELLEKEPGSPLI